jgi:hypothetical protein
MTIRLDHTVVPSRDPVAAAARLAALLGVPWSAAGAGPLWPVYVSDELTLDFDRADAVFPVLHFAFRIDEVEFDAIVGRLAAPGVAYRRTPHGPADGRINTAHGGRIVYWNEPDGHVWEALTVSVARAPASGPMGPGA